MLILQRNQQRLCRAQRQERRGEHHRQADQCLEPVRRLVFDLDDQRDEDDDKASNQNDEYRGTIAGVGEPVVKTACVASRRHIEEPTKQPALSASRTLASKATQDGLTQGRPGLRDRRHGPGLTPAASKSSGRNEKGRHSAALMIVDGYLIS